MSAELLALQAADFGWVRSLDSIWSDDATDSAPNEDLIDGVITELARTTRSPNPPGRVFLGQAGIGKTHLVSVLRRKAWAEGCWFVMLDVVGITDFWKSAALSFVTSLLQEMPDGQGHRQQGDLQLHHSVSGQAEFAHRSAIREKHDHRDRGIGR